MKLPLFRLIHDIINENGDKSFANHGMLWLRNRPLFSVMNVTAITIHEMEKQKANMNASILLIRYIIHSRITGANLLCLVRFSLSLSSDYSYSGEYISSDIIVWISIARIHINCNTEPDRREKK